MDTKAAMHEMVVRSGLTHRQISARLGKHETYVSQTLRRVPGADTVAAIASACGYRLELVPVCGGESIPIGDNSSASSTPEHAAIEQTRALLTRALQTLDSVSSMSVASSGGTTD